MKIVKLFCFLFLFTTHVAVGQNDYIVKTAPQKSNAAKEEERFVDDYFPYYSLCNWVPGMKFMYVLEEKYRFIPTFSSYDTGERVDNNLLYQKIMVLDSIEEIEKKQGRNAFSTRFVFESDGKKYYHEFKNQRLNEICVQAPRSLIRGLVYLGDIDKARELLVDRKVYSQINKLRVDDSNSANGYREVNIPLNLELRIVAVGAGTREFPVKIVVEDNSGNSYYTELAFSTTNSGLVKTDFQGELRNRYFPNVFTFDDQHLKSLSEIKDNFAGKYIYPKRNLDAKLNGRSTVLFRFTPLKIVDMEVGDDKISAVLTLRDTGGNVYTVPTKLKYDVVIKNDDYFYDLFAEGNLRKEYPYISDENWAFIVNGEVRPGMTKDECRLSLGSPIQISANLNSRYETWFYNGKVLEFEDGKLARIK